MEEEKDQLPTEETEETTEETEEAPEVETETEESKETEEEPITIDKTYELATALQKGYTLTRQDLAEIRRNQEGIQEALTRLNKKDEYVDEDRPLTVKEFLKIQDEQRQSKIREDQKINQQIDTQIDELKARGVIKSKEDEDAVLNYAISEKKQGKNKDLITAGLDWKELQEAKKEGEKTLAQAKNKVKQEEGSKVGTSQKTKTEREQGVNYEEIHTKSLDELASEE